MSQPHNYRLPPCRVFLEIILPHEARVLKPTGTRGLFNLQSFITISDYILSKKTRANYAYKKHIFQDATSPIVKQKQLNSEGTK